MTVVWADKPIKANEELKSAIDFSHFSSSFRFILMIQ